jgi:hypothetical protein
MAQEVERTKPVTIFHGHNLNINTATALGPSGDLVASEVTIKAMVTNAGSVYVGSSTVATTTGFELRAGQQVTITAGSPSDLYVIGAIGVTTDDVSWIAT